ncbi:hypothetical protein CF326_g1359 [Tilletia indica]|nr:hypothetical protein CF326_g1359 [Tilletia indica]
MAAKVNNLVHISFFAGGFWSHAKSALHYSITLCRHSPNLVISLSLSEEVAGKAKAAIDRMLEEETPNAEAAMDVRARLNLVPLITPDDYECPPELVNTPVDCFKAASAAFAVYWDCIHREPQDLPRPSLLIVDVLTVYEPEQIKSVNDVPILFWWPMNLNYFAYHFGPDQSGGLRPAYTKACETITDRELLYCAMERVFNSTSSEVARTGDLRPFHHYEQLCLRVPDMPGAGVFTHTAASNALQKADGHIICSGSWLEPNACKILKSYYGNTLRKPTYCANLRVSMTDDRTSTAFPQNGIAGRSPSESDILSFLDKALEKDGPDSVFYLSWGTVFCPSANLWQVDVFLDVMIENNQPFIMSQATIAAFMNPGLEERLEKAQKAGICATAAWVPQEAILKHKALGAFITHGGWNSTSEAIAAAKPMIYWPLDSDQPFVAMHFADGPEPAAWQLYETRGPTISEFCPYHFRDGPKTSATGESIPVPTGTPEALRIEFERVSLREAAAGSSELEKRKERMVALRQQFIESRQPGGETQRAISDLLTPLGCQIRA